MIEIIIARFTILNESEKINGFRTFNVKYDHQNNNFNHFDKKLFNKKLFIKKVKSYFESNKLSIDWESLTKIEDTTLIIIIAMVCPFNNNEKQMLLESKNIN